MDRNEHVIALLRAMGPCELGHITSELKFQWDSRCDEDVARRALMELERDGFIERDESEDGVESWDIRHSV